MSEVLVIGVLGIFSNALIFLLPGLQSPFRLAFANKEFAAIVTVIFVLLTWPTGAREAFTDGANLGLARMVRIIVFVLIFVYLTLKNAPLPSRREPGLLAFGAYVLVCFSSSFYAPSVFETIWKSFEILVLFLFALRTRALIRDGRLDFTNVIAIFVVLFLKKRLKNKTTGRSSGDDVRVLNSYGRPSLRYNLFWF